MEKSREVASIGLLAVALEQTRADDLGLAGFGIERPWNELNWRSISSLVACIEGVSTSKAK
jgi:hypothetical protein